LEAVLFLSRESLNSRKLSEYADLEDGTEARTLIQQLNQLYQDEQSVLRVERVAGGYQLVTHWQFGRWLKRLGAGQAGIRLSAPAMETLAVVAHRQPVLRVQVEAIRGVSCGEMLRQLMERDLVRIRGRSEELGRPYLYGTTKRFLQQFGLDSIEELLAADTFSCGDDLVEDATVTTGTGGDTADKEEVSDEKWDDTKDKESEDDSYDKDDKDLEEEEFEDEDEWEEVDGDDDDDEEEVDESWQDEDEWEEDEEESDT
jgi:segregation and condensation protein B